jgi:hypothetical protein
MMHIFDAAVCPDQDTLRTLLDQQVLVGGGYLGGAATHVWTLAEWRRLQQAQIRPLPIWVAPYESMFHEMGAIAGNAALSAMQQLGLESLVVLDLQAGYNVREDYVQGFYDALVEGRCDLALYGTPSDLRHMSAFVNPIFTWVAAPSASWTFLGDDAAAWQYAFHQSYDLSVADSDILTAEWGRTL